MSQPTVFFYLEDGEDLLQFDSRPLGEYPETARTGLMDYTEYMVLREETLEGELPGRFELARQALEEIPEHVMDEPYAYERPGSEAVDELAEFGKELEPGRESREAFLEKARDYGIDQLVKMPVFTGDIKVEIGETSF
ncbi:MAG: hypothetical protein ABEJ75_04505 [Candidatus Nanohaloarchaea archaeon]